MTGIANAVGLGLGPGLSGGGGGGGGSSLCDAFFCEETGNVFMIIVCSTLIYLALPSTSSSVDRNFVTLSTPPDYPFPLSLR